MFCIKILYFFNYTFTFCKVKDIEIVETFRFRGRKNTSLSYFSDFKKKFLNKEQLYVSLYLYYYNKSLFQIKLN